MSFLLFLPQTHGSTLPPTNHDTFIIWHFYSIVSSLNKAIDALAKSDAIVFTYNWHTMMSFHVNVFCHTISLSPVSMSDFSSIYKKFTFDLMSCTISSSAFLRYRNLKWHRLMSAVLVTHSYQFQYFSIPHHAVLLGR